MKKLILLGIFFMLVLSSIALADLTVSDANLGGDEQERTFDEDEPVYAEATFTITNTDNVTNVTGISISDDAASKYNVTFSGFSDNFNLSANSSVQITVKAIVPKDFDAVDNNGNAKVDDIGDIIVTSSLPEIVRANLLMQAENMLEIDRVTLEWDGESERVSDDELVDKIKPGDSLKLIVKVKNLYSTSGDYNFDIDEIELELEASDSDLEIDDEIKDIGTIDPRDTEEVTFDIDVDSEIDEDTYNLDLTLIGEDENGALHGMTWRVRIEIEREREDIRIKTAELLPETVSCNRDVRLEVRIENIGSKNSDEIVLLVESDDFDYKQKLVDIDLNSEDDYSKTFTISIPDDADAGIYLFSVKTFFDSSDYNDDDYNDVKDVVLTVRDCATAPPADEEEEEEEEPIIIQPIQPTTPTGGVVYGKPVTQVDDFLESNAYIALLAIGALIGIALLFLAIAIVVRR